MNTTTTTVEFIRMLQDRAVRVEEERDEARKLAEEWRDIAEECAGMIACSIEGAGFELDKCPKLPWEGDNETAQ